jgi:hypothetical protein
LRVPVERDLVDLPAEIGNVLGDERLDRLAVPDDRLGLGEERDLDPQLPTVDVAKQERGVEIADREERVGDGGGVRKRRRGEIDPCAVRCGRQAAVARLVRNTW